MKDIMHRFLLNALCVLCVFMFSKSVMALNSKEALIFGVVPQQSTDKLLKDWAPIMRFLRKELQRPVRFASAPTIGEFALRCERGEYDIAFMNPYQYAKYSRKPGYRVLVNQSNKKLSGIIVVTKDSPIKNISDLNHQSIDFPSPNAFASSLLIQSELRKNKITYNPIFSGSHDSVYRNVAFNVSHAGGGIQRTLDAQPEQIKSKLRVLATTKGFTSHAIAVHPRVSPELQQAITKSLLKLPKSMLETLGFNKLQTAKDSDYDDLRTLDFPVSGPKTE